MKRLAVLLAVVLVLTACHQTIPKDYDGVDSESDISETETTTAEETTVSESEEFREPTDFINDEARELYNVIMANKPMWERDDMVGGTLIDLDFDGTPEFLVSYGANTVVEVLGIDGEKLIGITSLQTIVYIDALCMYESEDGLRRWVWHYYNADSFDFGLSSDMDWEYRVSLLDFSDGEVKEYVKFREVHKAFPNPDTGYEYYIDDIQLTPTADELDRYENGVLPAYPPSDRFFDLRDRFFEELYENAATNAYKLTPNCPDSEFVQEYDDWSDLTESELAESVAVLVNAYAAKDADYLMNPNAYAYIVINERHLNDEREYY